MSQQSKITMDDLDALSVPEILALRFCDFDWSAPLPEPYLNAIHKVQNEATDRGLALSPTLYIAKEWLSPEGRSAIGIPFYLMHPKLCGLEIAIKGEAEGSEPEDFMKLMRHEMGHCFDHAFGLSQKRDFTQIFGSPRKDYAPEFYLPSKRSHEYVEHLPEHYAQSHPLEDFAETFSVWLAPASDWRKRHARHPAVLKKLNFIESKAKVFAGQAPHQAMPLLGEVRKSVMPLSLHYKRQAALMAKIQAHATIK